MANLPRSQKSAHALIARWGNYGFLIRDGVKRRAMIGRNAYTPTQAALVEQGSERLFVSAYQLQVGPEWKLDTIQFDGKLYRIIAPIKGPRPNGLVIFYDCNVMYDSDVI